MDAVETVLYSAFGGFALSFLNLWEDSKKPKSERVPKDALYWFFFFCWPAISGGLAYIYIADGSTLRPFLAFSVGIGTPATLKNLAAAASRPGGPPASAEN